MHKHGRDYYLSDIPLNEAIRQIRRGRWPMPARCRYTESERVPLDRANGRVTAEPVWAERSSPHYDAAAMDGVAVRAADTVGASETSPLKLIRRRPSNLGRHGRPDAERRRRRDHGRGRAGNRTRRLLRYTPPYHHTSTCGLWVKTSRRRSWYCHRAISSVRTTLRRVRRLG